MSEWQPIETAPQDGTWVVLCRATDMDCIIAAVWEAADNDFSWATLDGSYHKNWGTHWMPLPEPPS